LSVLVINDVERAVSDDHAVAGAKATLDILRKVETLLNQHHRVGAILLCRFHQFHDVSGVSVGVFLHLFGVVGQAGGWIFGADAERCF